MTFSAKSRLSSLVLLVLTFVSFQLGAAGHPKSALIRYIGEQLKVEKPSIFVLNAALHESLELGFKHTQEGAFDQKGELTASGREALLRMFAPISGPTLESLYMTLSRPRYSNAMLIGPAGVGKSFLLNQLAILLSYGVVPPHLEAALGIRDNDSPFVQKIRESFLGKTQVVMIDYNLLSLDNTKQGQAFSKADVRMRTVLSGLFDAAKEDFRKTGLRTVFVIEEVATFPPLVQQTLKTILDKTGYKSNSSSLADKGSEVGYSVIGITTPGEFREMVGSDSAVERRYVKVPLLEPTEEQAFDILLTKQKEWEHIFGVEIDPHVFSYIISMRKFFANPPLAMPDSVLKVVEGLLVWTSNTVNRKHGPRITTDEAYEYLVRQSHLPVETWIPTEAGRPPLWDLAQRVKAKVIGHDRAVDQVVRRIKTGRTTGFREFQVFFIMGPSGSGKDTLAKALNEELFGHNGTHLRFDLAGVQGAGLRAILEGPALGSGSDHELPLLLKAIDQGPPNGVIVLNEAKDLPSDQFDALKVVVEDGVIRPRGRDSRERPLGLNVLFLMGQWGEELFEEVTDPEEQALIAATQTEEDLIRILQKGSDDGKKGAVPYALIQRAVRSGGLILLPPVPPSKFIEILKISVKQIIQNMKVRGKAELTVDDSVLKYVSDLAEKNSKQTRALDGMLKDLTETAISEAHDLGLAVRDSRIHIRMSRSAYVEVQELSAQGEVKKKFEFYAGTLLRSRCQDLLLKPQK